MRSHEREFTVPQPLRCCVLVQLLSLTSHRNVAGKSEAMHYSCYITAVTAGVDAPEIYHNESVASAKAAAADLHSRACKCRLRHVNNW